MPCPALHPLPKLHLTGLRSALHDRYLFTPALNAPLMRHDRPRPRRPPPNVPPPHLFPRPRRRRSPLVRVCLPPMRARWRSSGLPLPLRQGQHCSGVSPRHHPRRRPPPPHPHQPGHQSRRPHPYLVGSPPRRSTYRSSKGPGESTRRRPDYLLVLPPKHPLMPLSGLPRI